MGVVLRAPNTDLLIRGKSKTYLSASSAAAATTFTVESIVGFGISDFLLIGEIGAERSEIVQIHAVTAPSGSTITLIAAGALYAHEEGTPVYLVDQNRVEFSRATTETGTKATLATSDITPDQMDTIYDDTTNTMGFGFWRFNNETDSTFGNYSDAIPYAGYVIDSVNEIFERALSNAGTEVNPRLTYDTLYKFLNDFVTLANSFNKRWSEGKVIETELSTLSTGDWEVDLPSNIAQTFDPSAMISLRVSGFQDLDYISQREMNTVMIDMVYTKANGAILDSDTEIDLDNGAAFSSSGAIQINGDSISYTGKTSNQLTGVTGIATGGHADDSYAFQRPVSGVPAYYSFSAEGKIRLWPIASSEVNNRILYISYYRRIPKVDSLGDKILIQDISPAVEYVTYRILKFEAGGSLNLQDPDYIQFTQRFQQTINRDTPGQPRRVTLG